MLSLVNFLNESVGGYALAFGTGLGGSFTGGGLNARYNANRIAEQKHALAKLEGRRYRPLLGDVGRSIYTNGGRIPIVGAPINMFIYRQRMKKEKEVQDRINALRYGGY